MSQLINNVQEYTADMVLPNAYNSPKEYTPIFNLKSTVQTNKFGEKIIKLNIVVGKSQVASANKSTVTEYTIAVLHDP
jgi:hypothetical protein